MDKRMDKLMCAINDIAASVDHKALAPVVEEEADSPVRKPHDVSRDRHAMQGGKAKELLSSLAVGGSRPGATTAQASTASRQPSKPPPLRSPSAAQEQAAARRGEGADIDCGCVGRMGVPVHCSFTNLPNTNAPSIGASGPEEDGSSDGGSGGDEAPTGEPSLGDLMKVMAALTTKVEALDHNVRQMQQQQQQWKSEAAPGPADSRPS